MQPIEVVVNVQAGRKRPGPVQYSSDDQGGSVTIKATLAAGDGIEASIRQLWTEAEVFLERQGFTILKREAEVGPQKCALVDCKSPAVVGDLCAAHDLEARKAKLAQTEGRGRPPSATSPTPPDDSRGGSPSKDATSSAAAPGFEPATEPSKTTPEQARAAAVRRRYDRLVEKVKKALDEKYLPKDKYATLIQLVQQELGQRAKITMFAEVGPEKLVAWADAEGVD